MAKGAFLHPVGNGQGSFYFFSMLTGRVLNRLHATALPMPDNVIDKVHRIVRQQKNNPGLIFADRNLNPDEDEFDDDDDATYSDEDLNNERDEEDKELLYYDDAEDSDDNDNGWYHITFPWWMHHCWTIILLRRPCYQVKFQE